MSAKVSEIALHQNQYLQASHSLLTWIESSKSGIERLIDEMPSIFAIADSNGRVKRANFAFAQLVGRTVDECIDMDLRDVFNLEEGRALERAVRVVLQDNSSATALARQLAGSPRGSSVQSSAGAESRVTLETTIDSVTGGRRNILWQLSRFDGVHRGAKAWISYFGADVTDLRAFESNLVRIFAALPVGVLQIDSKFKVSGPYSDRAAVLLGQSDLSNRSLHELIFAPCWDTFTPQQKAGIGLLQACLGASELQFELARDELPRLVRYPANSGLGELWLSLTIQPRVENSIVVGFLILIEDRTALEILNRQVERDRQSDSIKATRFIEVERLDEYVLASVVADIDTFLPRLGVGSSSPGDLLSMARTLHGLKGTARFARLTRLKDMCHNLEEMLLDSSAAAQKGFHETIAKETAAVQQETTDVKKIVAWMLSQTARAEDPNSISFKVEAMRGRLLSLVKETAAQHNKEVHLQFDFTFDQNADRKWHVAQMDAFCEALVHIVTNAVDHGIETAELRKQNSKPTLGLIKVRIEVCNDVINCTVQDDGAGLDWAALLHQGHKRGFLNSERLNALVPLATIATRESVDSRSQELLNETCFELLLTNGFSSKDAVAASSGRGIGLAAARNAIIGLRGSFGMAHRVGKGLTFQMSLPF